MPGCRESLRGHPAFNQRMDRLSRWPLYPSAWRGTRIQLYNKFLTFRAHRCSLRVDVHGPFWPARALSAWPRSGPSDPWTVSSQPENEIGCSLWDSGFNRQAPCGFQAKAQRWQPGVRIQDRDSKAWSTLARGTSNPLPVSWQHRLPGNPNTSTEVVASASNARKEIGPPLSQSRAQSPEPWQFPGPLRISLSAAS